MSHRPDFAGYDDWPAHARTVHPAVVFCLIPAATCADKPVPTRLPDLVECQPHHIANEDTTDNRCPRR